LALPILLNGSKIWTLREKDKKRIDINPDKRFQKNSRLPHPALQANEEVLEELEVEIVDEKLRRYKSNYLGQAARINSKEIPKNNVEL